MKTIRLLVNGASGRMGQAVCRLIAGDDRFELVAALRKTPVAASPAMPWLAVSEMAAAPAFDLAIDFGLPEGLGDLLRLCRQRGAAVVSGVTGLNTEQEAALREAAAEIPVLWAANFSLGVAVLGLLTREAAARLGGWDVDIVESHHRYKRDAPSGTALRLGASVTEGGAAEPTLHSLRAGDVVGEHSVIFAGAGERLELSHRATHRDVFARGAIFAAAWLAGKGAGRYSIEQTLPTHASGA